MQIPLLWGPLWGHPPLNAQAAGIKVPQCWAASAGSGPSFPKCQIWPCRVIQMFGKGGGQVPLWIVLPFSSPAAQGSSGIANPPPPGTRDTRRSGILLPSLGCPRAGSGSVVLRWAENTLQLVTHGGQLISI